jgi:hypothetical protein
MSKEKITTVKAIREYMGSPGYPKVEISELKALSTQDRKEMGKLCAEAMGKVIDDVKPK